MGSPAVLLTDFGLEDPYVGQMKGVLAALAPGARVIDLCHGVRPFDVLQASFFLDSSRAHFAPGSVFVCVVDPGVGGERRLVLLEKFRQIFLAPDNGLLSLVLAQDGPCRTRDVTPAGRLASTGTFHGRDILAPLAARLLTGDEPEDLGAEVNPESLTRLPGAAPERDGPTLRAVVLHVDRFGNCILNLDTARFGPSVFASGGCAMASPERMPVMPATTYEKLAQGQLGLIAGSQGYLELAMDRASAADALGLAPGDAVSLVLEGR